MNSPYPRWAAPSSWGFSLLKLDCRPSNSLVSFEKKDMMPLYRFAMKSAGSGRGEDQGDGNRITMCVGEVGERRGAAGVFTCNEGPGGNGEQLMLLSHVCSRRFEQTEGGLLTPLWSPPETLQAESFHVIPRAAKTSTGCTPRNTVDRVITRLGDSVRSLRVSKSTAAGPPDGRYLRGGGGAGGRKKEGQKGGWRDGEGSSGPRCGPDRYLVGGVVWTVRMGKWGYRGMGCKSASEARREGR